MADLERVVMPGVTHWHHPKFFAYFPTANSYPAIVADMWVVTYLIVTYIVVIYVIKVQAPQIENPDELPVTRFPTTFF